MDRKTFLETLNNRGIPRNKWQKEMNRYRDAAGYFSDDPEMLKDQEVVFKPNQILHYDPRPSMTQYELELYNQFTTEEDEYKFISDQFLQSKYNDPYMSPVIRDIMIRKEMGLGDEDPINYGAYVTKQRLDYPEASNEWMVSPRERFEMRNPEQAPPRSAITADNLTLAEKERRFFDKQMGSRWKSASSLMATYFETSPFRTTLRIDDFKKKVLNGQVGKRFINGDIIQGSGGFKEAAQFGYLGVNFN